MVDPYALSRWGHWATFLALSLGLMLLTLLPLDVGTGRWPGPQWVLAIALAWTVRRPDFLPLPLLAAVALVADLLFLRPPGLWAALTVLAAEFLRGRAQVAREWPFLLEWGVVTLLLAAMTLANRVVLGIFATVQPGLGIELQGLVSTMLVYPAVVALSVSVLGVRRQLPGEPGTSGRART